MVGAPVKSSQLRLTCRLPVTDFSNLCVQITVTGRTAQRRLEHGEGGGLGYETALGWDGSSSQSVMG
ncbi:hypothetical protein AGIG_G2525 [Arapaima gigas]